MIPDFFHSVYEGGPFSQCDCCRTDLTAPGTIYLVLKHLHHRADGPAEAIVEFALCVDCLMTQVPDPSEESREAIMAFRAERRAELPPSDRIFQRPPADNVPEACELCGRAAGDCRTFSARAVVETDDEGTPSMHRMVGTRFTGMSPAMMCDQCHGQMSERLSRQTRDDWDRFYEQIDDSPPALEWDDSPRPVFV